MSEALDLLLPAIAQDAQQTKNAEAHVDRYWTYILPILSQYGPSVPDEEAVKRRYWSELALLHLLVGLVEHQWVSRKGNTPFLFWASRFEDLLYAWYEPTPGLREQIREWVLRQSEDNGVLQVFSSAVEKAFAEKEPRRTLGEFYTPFHLAQHLVDSLQIDAKWVMSSVKIVDPASGSGSLLGAVEQRLVEMALARDTLARQTWQWLSGTLWGFDIQPCAVLLTRLRLILGALPILDSLNSTISAPLFSNVHLLDPLAEPEHYWGSAGQFSHVIANPPFAKLVRKRVAFLDRYEEVIYGQPNLYQLFLWWAVRATKPGGKIAFFIPQSLRSGLYFHKLRGQLAANCDLQAVTLFTNRIGVFDGVDSPLMTVTLQKRLHGPLPEIGDTVVVRVSSNGNNLTGREWPVVAREKVLRSHPKGPIWCISDQSADYDILDKVYANATRLTELAERFVVQNGGFVWNQHQDILQAEVGDGAVPLLSAPSVRPFQFNFPVADLKRKERQFALVTLKVAGRQHAERLVLVKRTTPKKRGRRVVATLIPEEFIADHPAFFVENHLNTIKAFCESDLAFLKGLVGWLNSRLLNFIFQLMNGTSHISVFELNLLPIPVSWLPQLAEAVDKLSEASGHERPLLWSALDRRIYDFYELTKVERKRVNTWIP